VYEAKTVDARSFIAFRQRRLVLTFALYAGTFAEGEAIGRVPMYCRLPPKGLRLARSSKLARLFDVAGFSLERRDRIPLARLQHKLFRVRVGDVETSGEPGIDRRPQVLPPAARYSVVREVLERLA
jgi:hypothetical protein